MIKIISCSIIKNELDFLLKDKDPLINIEFINSDYHIKRTELNELILDKINKTDIDDTIIFLYGDCFINNMGITFPNRKILTPGVKNCCELFFTNEEFKKLAYETKVFFLLHEWVIKWKKIFKFYLKMNQKQAQFIFQDLYSKFVYIETGKNPYPQKEINEIKDFFDIDIESINIDNNSLKSRISKLLIEAKK
jgi:hypothetical protein